MITPSFSLTATERILPRMALDFTTASLDSRVTFTRTGNTATVTNSSGFVVPINADLPRFDYDPITLLCKGLLIEEARTNLLLRSQEFDDAAWPKTNLTVSANAIVSPNGTLDADKLVENTAASVDHRTQQLQTILTTTAYTGSVYLKAAERTIVDVLIYRGATFAGASVNLSTGVASAPLSPAVTNLSATTVVTNVGNGWYRVLIPITSDGLSGGVRVTLTNGSSVQYTGDGVSGCYVWGAQMEAGAFATSYIPTAGSQVTRTADVAVMTGANFSDWYNASEGAFYCQCICTGILNVNAPRPLSLSNGTTSNLMEFYGASATGLGFQVIDGGAAQANILLSAFASDVNKPVGGYKVNNFAFAVNGSATSTDLAGNIPSLNKMNIGNRTDLLRGWNGYIQKVLYWPQRIINAEVQAFSK